MKNIGSSFTEMLDICTNSACGNVEQGSLRYNFTCISIFSYDLHIILAFLARTQKLIRHAQFPYRLHCNISHVFILRTQNWYQIHKIHHRLYRRRICKFSALIRFRLMCLARSQSSLTNGWPIMRAETDNCKTNKDWKCTRFCPSNNFYSLCHY